MTSTIPNNNQDNEDPFDISRIPMDQEFINPNVNYRILIIELRERIMNLQHDRNAIKDPELRGYAEKLYFNLKQEYFNLLSKDLSLQHQMIVEEGLSYISHSIENLGGSNDE